MQQKIAIKYSGFSKKFVANIEHIIPFIASIKSVNKASHLCPLRSTFVAPVLHEPNPLISTFPKNFVKINPDGIEPSK